MYRATDLKLKRQVALKVLPAAVVADPERLARFRREAEILASLNHPNIAAIYGLEDAGDTPALVMELVEGPTLAERIAQAAGSGLRAPGFGPRQGGLPVTEALPIARQIAEALEAAHEQGIIHRDLKPANIKVRDDGTVKVLDFGLAKAIERAGRTGGTSEAGDVGRADGWIGNAGPDALSNSPTLTSPAMMTGVGVLLGTAAYMSPEQAKGRPADKRSDIWAFGCVLYEMLTGQRAFPGEDVTDTLAAIVRAEPDWKVLPGELSPTLLAFVHRCVHKDPNQRVGDIHDVRLALDGAFESVPRSESVAPGAPSRSRWIVAAVGGALLGAGMAALILSGVMRSRQPSERLTVRFAITAPAPYAVAGGIDGGIAIAPDGSRVVYVSRSGADRQLTLRAIDALAEQPLRNTTGARSPFFSPDGRWIGFFTTSELRKISIEGGQAITICRTVGPPFGASWGPDGTIVFATGNVDGLLAVRATGGEPQVITGPDFAKGEARYEAPTMLPDGTLLFTILSTGNDGPRLVSFDKNTGQKKGLLDGISGQVYYADDVRQLVFAEGFDVRAVGFDLERREVLGEPITLAEQVASAEGRAARFGIARSGALVYIQRSPIIAGSDGSSRALIWVDRQGREEALTLPRRPYVYPRLSPDGTRLAVDLRDQEQDIWLWDFAEQLFRRATFDPKRDSNPAWTPDGRRIVFSSARAGAPNLFWQRADGTGAAERLTTSPNPQFSYAVSPSNEVLFREDKAVSGNDLYVLHLESRKAEPVVDLGFGENNADLSPDGRWVAYQELGPSGTPEVIVRPFPNVAGGRWQVSLAGGTKPVWTRNGRELCFLTDALVTCALVETAGTFKAGPPITMLNKRYWNLQAGRTFDVSADGQRFLMIKDESLENSPTADGSLVPK